MMRIVTIAQFRISKKDKTNQKWEFNVFQVSEASKQRPLTYVLYELLKKYGLLSTFKVKFHGRECLDMMSLWLMFATAINGTHPNIQIPTNVLMNFADRVDQGYRKFRNPYHNPNHAADVAQTTHFFVCQTGEFCIRHIMEPAD